MFIAAQTVNYSFLISFLFNSYPSDTYLNVRVFSTCTPLAKIQNYVKSDTQSTRNQIRRLQPLTSNSTRSIIFIRIMLFLT